jgi:CRISPR/Cas system-associated exonuclease Cas4 (RecB family)
MPGQSPKAERLKEEAGDRELPYISKSRLKSFVTCPRKFFIKYIIGMPTEDNYHLRKGTHLHSLFEEFYEEIERARRGEMGDAEDLTPLIDYIPSPRTDLLWGPFKQHVSSFLEFEARRMKAAYGIDDYMPQSIEEEMWLDNTPLLDNTPWFGYTDLIVNSWTIPEVDADTGVTIVDFKTGKTPDKQYRDEGIHLENEFYGIIAESKGYNVTGLVGYYPQNDDVIATTPNQSRYRKVVESVEEMVSIDDQEDAPKDEQPLCKWDEGEENQCDFYSTKPWADPSEGECDSTWGQEHGLGPNYV